LMIAITIHKTEKVKLSCGEKKHPRLVNLNNLIRDSDVTCKSEFRMNRHTFNILCEMSGILGV